MRRTRPTIMETPTQQGAPTQSGGPPAATTRRAVLRGGSGAALIAMAGACARPDPGAGADMADWDAVETAAKIRSGEVSAAEVVEAAIARAERIEPQLNAIVAKTYARARKAVANATGPWAGVPTLIKDLEDVTGVPTGFGSRAFPGYRGSAQTPLTNAYFDMGVISIGKSATPEFGLSATTEPVRGGVTRNPWNTEHSCGGSSGGAAALVAAGVVPVAHASDGGGSIRIPASCCGTVGLKVSRTRYPEARPTIAGPIVISVHGVQSRSVRDTAAVIAAMETPPQVSGVAPVGLVSGPSRRRLKMAYVTRGLRGEAIDGAVEAATARVAAQCESLGHTVEPFAMPFDLVAEDDFILYWSAFAHGAVSIWEKRFRLPRNRLAFEQFTLGLARHYEDNIDRFEETVARLQAAPAQMAAVFDNYDVILSPVVAAPPPPIGALSGRLDFETLMARLIDYVQFTSFYNVAGNPAISLPLSMSPDGLPIGTMFAAADGDEKTLLALSYELEEAMPWRARRPAVFG